MKKTIVYTTENRSMDVQDEPQLLDLCIKNDIPIDHVCEGGASCGTCRVLITSDPKDLPPRNSLEQEMASDREFSPEERLACQLPLNQSFSFKLPKDEK